MNPVYLIVEEVSIEKCQDELNRLVEAGYQVKFFGRKTDSEELVTIWWALMELAE